MFACTPVTSLFAEKPGEQTFNVNLSEKIKLPSGTVEGVLSNGLRYIILPNNNPEGRTEFRLIWKVGAVQQDDDQGGSAHFLEHMAFGGSKNFPDRGAVAYLESLGMKYGIDINAFTGHDRTIYMFAVPTDSLSNGDYDKPLSIIRDWADALTINPKRVETEKGIILEELRSSFQDDPFYSLKIGQNRYSARMPLGSPEEVERMTARTLKEYYKKWYIPSLGAIVVVGNVDVPLLEKEIKRKFSSLKKRKDPGFLHYPLSYAPSRQIMFLSDSLNMRDEVEIIIPHPTLVTRTLGDFRLKQMGSVITAALSARIQKRGLRADVSDAWYLGDTNHLVFNIRATDEIPLDSMVSLVAGEVVNVRDNGFGSEEISFYAKRAASHVAEISVEGTPSDSWCEDFADYIISGDRYLSDPVQIEVVSKAVEAISAYEATAMLQGWLSHISSTLLMAVKTTPENCDNLSMEKLSAALRSGAARGAEEYEFEKPVEKVYEKIDVPEVLSVIHPFKSSSISSVRDYPGLGIEEITLSNGIKLRLKPTMDEGNVLFSMLGPGGYSSIKPEKMPLLGGAASYIDMGGIAKCGPELGDFMYQNDMAFNTVLENDWHGFLGAFNSLQAHIFANLIYEKITDPELRYDDFEEVRQGMLESVGKESILTRMLNRASDRQLMARMDELMGNTLDDRLAYLGVKDRNTAQRDFINAMNLDSIADFYKSLYTNPTGAIVTVCGTFDRDSILRAFVPVLTKLGTPGEEVLRRYPLELPDSTYIERFPNENESQTEFNYLYFNRFEPGLRNSLVLKLMTNLLRNRVINVLREQKALVYSPYVNLNYEGIPRGYFYFDINSSSKSSNMPAVEATIKEILASLREKAPDAGELDAIKRACNIARRETLTPHSPSAWRTTLLSLDKNGESLEDFEKYEEIIATITPEEVQEAFKTLIDPDKFVLLYMSDQEIER